MAGIYVHIPFCKQACHYCNFHFSTSLNLKDELVDSLTQELVNEMGFLENESIDTIYFGGGTPSLLNEIELSKILNTIRTHYKLNEKAEITLEANPDDLSESKLEQFKIAGINRLSIGIQSFFDEDLKWMNRSHDAKQSFSCITNAHKLGFDNISIDLIFGSPTTSNENWKINLEKAIEFNIPHLSCYGLTVEPKTALDHFVSTGKMKAPNNETSALQFESTMNILTTSNYQHYEISNYAKVGFESKHNSNYWKQEKYLGIGPAAHSFNGILRRWNIANNKKYIEGLSSSECVYTSETLTAKDKYNEYLLTGLRTHWGCDLDRIKDLGESFHEYCLITSDKMISEGKLIKEENTLILSDASKLVADNVISELFMT